MPTEVSASVVEMDDEALLGFARKQNGSRVTDLNWILKVEQNSERKKSAWSWIFSIFQPLMSCYYHCIHFLLFII
jgi:hypothetical protein